MNLKGDPIFMNGPDIRRLQDFFLSAQDDHLDGAMTPTATRIDGQSSQVLSAGQPIAAHYHQRDPATDMVFTAHLGSTIKTLETHRSGSTPLFVSYYTKDTPYQPLAEELNKSLNRLGLASQIEPIASLGSWVANTGMKSEFVLRMWHESERPICWLDADAEVLRTPQFVNGNPFDLCIVRRHGWYDMSGFLYLNKTPAVEELLNNWKQLCDANPSVWDQVLFTIAWYQTVQTNNFSTYFLPDGIFRFPRSKLRDWRDAAFYYPRKRKVRPYFDQKQASRQLKDYISASPKKVVEFGSDDVPDAFRNALANFDFSAPVGSLLGSAPINGI